MSNVKELLDAGVHFGHQTRKWNPKMKEYIFEARNGIHIIDLVQTATQVDGAADFLKGVVAKGGKVLFVGTKKQAQVSIKETAETTGQPYVCERWLGGMMTNLNTIRKSIKRMVELETMESDGRMAEFVKQEQSMLRRELNRLHIRLNGIRDLNSKPDAMFIVDIKREHNALAEARRLRVPVVAIVDTNTDPTLVDYPIAGNDDALPLIRGHLTWMEYSDQLPEYLPPDGGPDTFSADYQKVWGTPNRFVEYAGNPSVSVGGGSSDGHRVYLIYQGLIHQTRMATSGNGTKRDVQLFEELMKEDWWLEQLARRNASAIWLRSKYPHNYVSAAAAVVASSFGLRRGCTVRASHSPTTASTGLSRRRRARSPRSGSPRSRPRLPRLRRPARNTRLAPPLARRSALSVSS